MTSERAYADGKLIARRENGLGWLIINNPERRNALSLAMWQGVTEIVREFEADPEVRVIVLKGEGEKAFTAGADISRFEIERGTPEGVKAYEAATSDAYAAVRHAAKPTIARVHGFCMGGGMAMAICCDLRVAETGAVFGIPAARLGVGYGYDAVKTLVDLIGPSFTKEVLFTARQFTAQEAAAMGLINRAVAPEALDHTVAEMAARIAENAPLTIKAVATAVDDILRDPSQRDRAAVDRLVSECFASQDFQEGRTAFLEKRKPKFRGV